MQTSRLLERDGYLGFEQLDSIEELIALTNDLGDMIPCEGKKFYNLRPSEEKGTSSRSFSYHYGLNEFPLHTDTSYWRVPARYIIFMQRRGPIRTLAFCLPASPRKYSPSIWKTIQSSVQRRSAGLYTKAHGFLDQMATSSTTLVICAQRTPRQRSWWLICNAVESGWLSGSRGKRDRH